MKEQNTGEVDALREENERLKATPSEMNEKNREDARKLHELMDVPMGVRGWNEEAAAEEIARICSEAVKSALRKAKAYLWPDAPDFEPTPEGLEKAILTAEPEPCEDEEFEEDFHEAISEAVHDIDITACDWEQPYYNEESAMSIIESRLRPFTASHRLQEMQAENERLREALEPFADADCEDERYSDEDNPQLLSCEEYGRPRAEWCAVCNAKAALSTHPDNGEEASDLEKYGAELREWQLDSRLYEVDANVVRQIYEVENTEKAQKLIIDYRLRLSRPLFAHNFPGGVKP